ncbi:hypothetical protein QF028_002602 [Neobacillus sp. B4I6]|uniref:hypothetical protein n=1 Tax=Neobacillus sp. B4I6 TaxID=3373925 RepID=UPI003D1C9BA5
MNNYTVLISGLFALTGALVGQAYNNFLTNKRERKKYEKEIYQELFSPILLDIIAFYDIKTNWRRGHDIRDHVKEDDLVLHIKEKISSNIKYANSPIISAYHDLKRFDYYEDFTGFIQEQKWLKLCLTLLDETYKFVKKEKLLHENQLVLINNYRIKYFIWYLLIEHIGDQDQATEIISAFWCISPETFTESFYEHLLVRFEHVKREYFATVFESELKHLVIDGCEGLFQEMVERIENNISGSTVISDTDS